MVRIRLIRVGRRNDPHFRIVAQDQKRAPKGAYLELLGTWSPVDKKHTLNKDRVSFWLSRGAKPSDTVWNLCVSQGVIKGKKIAVHNKPKKKAQEEAAPAVAAA